MSDYTVFGWPAKANTYRITFLDDQGVETELVDSQEDTSYGYDSPDARSGLLLVYPNYDSGIGRPYTFPINEPPSLATIRWNTRTILNDVEAVEAVDIKYPDEPKWPDSELNNYIREAIGLFNTYLPRERVIETNIKDLRPATLGDYEQVLSVSYFREVVNEKQWVLIPRVGRLRARPHTIGWDYDGSHIQLYNVPSSARLEIRVSCKYPVPMNDRQPILVPKEDWDILYVYTQGKSMVRLEAQDAQLSRWKEEGSRRDNPIIPVGKYLMKDAIARLQDRKDPRGVRRYRT